MTNFRSPTRRLTRQRSGFNVTDGSTGGECKIKRAKTLYFEGNEIELHFSKGGIIVPELFGGMKGVVAFGGYIRTSVPTIVQVTIQGKYQGIDFSRTMTYNLQGGEWANIGAHRELDLEESLESIVDLEAILAIQSSENYVAIDFFGINLGAIHNESYEENLLYADGKDIYFRFKQKTEICIPYLYYFDHDGPFIDWPDNVSSDDFEDGPAVLLKDCNRCGRYLPIEFIKEKQRNLISFGNHCTAKECTHGNFTNLKLVDDECSKQGMDLPNDLKNIMHSGFDTRISIFYGYQLECKACKKFFVNAALNPARSTTQHREDSLRRRAIEVLVDTLLGNEWIYHKFRRQYSEEFDEHILNKFDKKCFACGKNLASCRQMHLDHTLPLSALWPLDETATCLCASCNSEKSDKFPFEFYSDDQLRRLSGITGIDFSKLKTATINEEALAYLIGKIHWFFDEFLMGPDYQKVRDGKRVSDLILRAIQRQLELFDPTIDLVDIYIQKMGHAPASVSTD